MAASALASEPTQEVLSWLKTLPLAPEYHPSLAEFQDPIAYILKIEKEASKYGICKIVPPVPASPKKTAIANLNRSLAARVASSEGNSSKSLPTFNTRQQQIGFCPRKPRPVQKPVWQSGEQYTFQQFEAKAKSFEKNYLKKCAKKGGLSALEIETLYWKATVDKPFSVEYANDMPGSAFAPVNAKKCRETGDGVTLGETAWNMRGVARAKGSLLRFMKEEIPGVTSPMVYVAMMFSWFAWHVEDHDLHSLNYMHMGAGKTWYGVPREAAVAFEEVVRIHGYGGEINPLVTFAILGEKTTVMSPEVFIRAGVPCCRLVQNAGEFVVTFPRAYHTGFSHGFNCGEATNIATPEWLNVAKDAAIRRASINYPPMVSHFQLLYDLALALCSRTQVGTNAEPRSLRLKDKKKGESETMIKEQFVQSLVQNNELLHILGKGSSVVFLPRNSSYISVCSKLRVGSQLGVNLRLPLGFHGLKESVKTAKSLDCDNPSLEQVQEMKHVKGLCSMKGRFSSLYDKNKIPSPGTFGSSYKGNIYPSVCEDDNARASNTSNLNIGSERESTVRGDGMSDQRLFSCVTCGILCFACVAIVHPREPAARYLMSADCSFFNDWVVGSGVSGDGLGTTNGHAFTSEQNVHNGARELEKRVPDGLYDVPVQSVDRQLQTPERSYETILNTETQRDTSALDLLASAYRNSSDSEEDHIEPDISLDADKANSMNCTSESKYQSKNTCCNDSEFGVHSLLSSRFNLRDEVSHDVIDCNGESVYGRVKLKGNTPDSCVKFETDNIGSTKSNGMDGRFRDSMAASQIAETHSPDDQDAEVHGEVAVTKGNKNMSLVPRSDEDSSRHHIFCLEHAVEVEQLLRQIGGVHIMLYCHPEYPKIEGEAKSIAQDLGINHLWNDITYRDTNKEDEERIQSALDSEEAIPGNGDWAVKLGINLFYSANLCRSPLYSKQMPYNSVIYNAFGRISPATSSTNLNLSKKRSSRQKKVVAGKWCGKVWMSNQVHPFLAKRDPDGDEEDEEDDRSFHAWAMPDENLDRKPVNIKKTVPKTSSRKGGSKRKLKLGSGSTKKAKFVKTEDVVSDDSMEDNLPSRILRSWRTKVVERDDIMSDDLQEEDSCLDNRKTASYGESMSSDDSLGDHPHQQHREILSGKQAKWGMGRDEVSDDSLGDSVHQPHNRIAGSKQAKFIEGKAATSDYSLVNSSPQHYRRYSRRKPTKFIEKEDTHSDGLENSFIPQYGRIPQSKQSKCIDREDALTDDSVEDDNIRHKIIPGRRQPKYIEKEDSFPDDLQNSFLQQYRRVNKSKKAKCFENDDTISDGQMEDSQPNKRILRSKPSKPGFLQTNQVTGPRTKQGTSQRTKQGTQRLMKPEPSQRLKRSISSFQSNKPEQSSRLSDLDTEEELEGGPSKRLRKRTRNPLKEYEAKPKENKRTIKKKAKTVSGHKDSKVRDEEAEYMCDIEGCTMSFGSKQELILHKRNVCPVKGCEKKFFSHKYLVQHRRVHMDDRPLKCPWKGCKMTFKWAWARTEHFRVHTGARPYVCAEPGCGQTFRFVSDFSRHKRKTGHSVKKGRG